jgi:hypothetical protein
MSGITWPRQPVFKMSFSGTTTYPDLVSFATKRYQSEDVPTFAFQLFIGRHSEPKRDGQAEYPLAELL